MKKAANYFFILIFLILLATACTNAGKSDNDSTSANTAEITPQSNAKANEVIANDLFDKLMTAFSPDWMERESDPAIYPAFYGGSFISDQGKFVVAVTANTEANRKALADMMGSDDFILQTVQYSYAELLQIMNKIDDFLANPAIAEDNPALVNFAGAYPDVVDNRVRVTFTELNNNVTAAFKKDVSNSPAVIFEKGDRPVLH